MTRFLPGLLVGGLFYFVYGIATGAFLSIGLIAVSSLMIFSAPVVALFSNRIDQWAERRVRSAFIGRLSRLLFQWLVNLGLLGALFLTGVLTASGLAGLGGIVWAALFATLASQGFQHIALGAAEKGWGHNDLNVLLAFAAALLLNAFALAGIVFLQFVLMGIAYGLTVAGFFVALRTDRPVLAGLVGKFRRTSEDKRVSTT